MGHIVTGSTPPTANIEYYGGEKLFVSPADMNVGRYVSNTKTLLSDEGFKKGRLIKADSVMFVCIGSTIGKIAQNKIECITNQQINSIITNESNVSDFIYSRLEKDAYRISLLAGEQAVPLINKTDFSNVEIVVPELAEQQKIADFLSAVDDKITALTAQKTALTQYKQGMMQRIFAQTLRFKDDNGADYPEWVIYQLAQFLTPVIRQIPKPDKPYLAIGVRSHFKGLFQKPDSEPEKIDMDVLYQVEENDFVVNITFAWEGALAIANSSDSGGLVSHRFPTYRINPKFALVNFFRYVYPTKQFKSMLELCSPGGAGRNRVLNKSQFLKIETKLPSIDEQSKIAQFLTELDDKINAVDAQIQSAQQWKQGLLQQMFV